MSTQLLNLDTFVPDTKVIILKGDRHEAKELTVEEYIAKVAAAKDVKDEALSLDQQVTKTVEMVHEAFPTIALEVLRKMSLQQLTVILDFILKQPEQIATETAAAAGNA